MHRCTVVESVFLSEAPHRLLSCCICKHPNHSTVLASASPGTEAGSLRELRLLEEEGNLELFQLTFLPMTQAACGTCTHHPWLGMLQAPNCRGGEAMGDWIHPPLLA